MIPWTDGYNWLVSAVSFRWAFVPRALLLPRAIHIAATRVRVAMVKVSFGVQLILVARSIDCSIECLSRLR